MVEEFEITYPMISPGLKATFIDVAKETAAKEMDSPMVADSVLALKTGLSANVIKKTLEMGKAIEAGSLSGLSRLLGAWSSDPDWLDENGNPEVLQLQGAYGAKNFETLVRKTMGNLGYGPVIEALSKSNCVALTRSGGKKAVALRKAFYVPASKCAADSFETGCEGVAALGTTIKQNVGWSDLHPTRRHIQGTVRIRNLSLKHLDDFRAKMRQLQREFLNDRVIPQMTEFEKRNSREDPIPQVGIGFYLFEIHGDSALAPEYVDHENQLTDKGW